MNQIIKDLSIKTKILLIVAIDLLVILFSLYTSYLENNKMNELKSQFFINSKAVYHQLNADMMHDAIRTDCYAIIYHQNPEELKAIEIDLHRHSSKLESQFDSLQKLHLNESIKKSILKVKEPIHSYVSSANKILELQKKGKTTGAEIISLKKAFDVQFYALEISMEQINIEMNATLKDLDTEGDSNYQKSIYLKIILIISLIILAFIFIAYINYSIVKPIKTMELTLYNLAQGNNTNLLTNYNKDEIGKMQVSVNNIIKSLENINLFAQEVAEGNTENNTVIFNNNGEVHKHLQNMRLLIKAKTKDLEDALYESQHKNEEIAVINEELQSTQEELKQNLDYAVQVNNKLKSSESAIIEQNNFLNGLLSGTEYSIISLNPNGIIKIFNKGAEKLLGYSATEMIDKHSPEILHDSNEVIARAAALSIELNRVIEPGLNTFHAKSDLGFADTNEWTYIHKNGTRIPVLLSVTTLKNDKNETIGYLGIAVDLRERKKQEALILKTIKEKEIAEETAKTKELFLANMSHEIRTPMNAILGLSRLLEKSGELNTRQKEYVKTIHLNSNNLLNIINEILDFSKIEAGKMDLNKRNFVLQDCITQTFLSLENSAKDKNLNYDLQLDHSIGITVFADQVRLSQILLNLLSNAIKYTEKGGVKLQTQALYQEDDLIIVKFSIIDSGIGISSDKIASIFNPFSQVDDQYARKQGGTGLGLAIASRIAELYGSIIQVKSEINVGSEFSFIITFDIAKLQTSEKIIPVEHSIAEHKSKPNILLVEDNEFNRMVAIDTLMLWNPDINIESAENGIIALEKLKLKSYNLILMDIQMPLMDGYETTEQIRTTLKLNTPILAMTAHASTKEKEKCLNIGMNDFISKPFEEALLFEKINALTQTINPEKKSSEISQNNTSAIDNSVVDFDVILQFTKGKKERIEKMVNMFLIDTPLEIEKMKALLNEKNYPSLRTLAHSLKPKMAYMGLENMKEAAKSIEMAAGGEINLDEIPNLISELQRTCDKAYEELKMFMQNL